MNSRFHGMIHSYDGRTNSWNGVHQAHLFDVTAIQMADHHGRRVNGRVCVSVAFGTVCVFFISCNLNRSFTRSAAPKSNCNFISKPLVANFDIIVYGLNGFMDSSLRIVHKMMMMVDAQIEQCVCIWAYSDYTRIIININVKREVCAHTVNKRIYIYMRHRLYIHSTHQCNIKHFMDCAWWKGQWLRDEQTIANEPST